MILQAIFYVVIMLTSLPVGLLLTWLCRDELKSGRKWFLIIAYIATALVLVILGFMFFETIGRPICTIDSKVLGVVALTLIYLASLAIISSWKARKIS